MTHFTQLPAAAQAAHMAALARAALVHWDIACADLTLLKYRENAVFRVTDPGGVRYALRVHRAGYHSDAALRSELQWMRALDAAGIEVPRVIPTREGQTFAVARIDAVPAARQVDLFAWVEGAPIGSVESSVDDAPAPATYHTLGALAARLHNQAVAWSVPEGFERHRWDAEGLAGEEPLWGRFWELGTLTPAQRDILLAARDRVFDDLQRYGQAPENRTRYSLIHADFLPENVLEGGGDVRLIDFDDAGFGWHLFDLATALFLQTGQSHYPATRDALIAGYRAYRELPESQVAQLPLFLVARAFTYLGWVHTRAETATALEMTPFIVDKAMALIDAYYRR
jgi:Ser/Thr protein kinase RdoA (MazF antagonist)